jgi:hypothetical protein
VKSVATKRFWKLYRALPAEARAQAREAFKLFTANPAYPGLSLERLRCYPDCWSVRVSRNYRAVAHKHGDTMIWFWIGTHADFDREFPT